MVKRKIKGKRTCTESTFDYDCADEFDLKLEALAQETKKDPKTILEEMQDLYYWTTQEIKNGRVIGSIDNNNELESTYSLDVPRSIPSIRDENLLALIIDDGSQKHLKIANPFLDDWGCLIIAGKEKPYNRILKFDKSQREIYLRKPSIIERDATHPLYHRSFKKFLEDYKTLEGDFKLLEHDYEILFKEKLPKLTNKFRLVPKET